MKMLKVTKCLRVNSFVGAFISMVCESKITSGSKKNCVKISWRPDVALESYLRKTVLRGHEIHSNKKRGNVYMYIFKLIYTIVRDSSSNIE